LVKYAQTFTTEDKMPISIKLTLYDNILIGKYPGGNDDILVELDGSLGTFSVNLPDLTTCGNRIFMFKNLSASNVTLNTVHGQIIDYTGIESKVIAFKQFYSIASNQKDKWISLETNP
jgi:hypothetical protein